MLTAVLGITCGGSRGEDASHLCGTCCGTTSDATARGRRAASSRYDIRRASCVVCRASCVCACVVLAGALDNVLDH